MFLLPDEDFVYHYTRASTAIEYIFPTMKLRLGSPADTNDPVESFSMVSASGGASTPDRQVRMDALFAARALILGSRIACFSRDTRRSAGWQLHRMWAQYAEHHRGICLCLDRRALENCVAKLRTHERHVVGRNVEYMDRVDHSLDMEALLAEGAPAYIGRYFREDPSPYYFAKLQDWEGEAEYRLLVTGDGTERPYEYVEIAGALRGVVVGARFSSGYRVCIEELCSREHIPAWRVDYTADLGRVEYLMMR